MQRKIEYDAILLRRRELGWDDALLFHIRGYRAFLAKDAMINEFTLKVMIGELPFHVHHQYIGWWTRDGEDDAELLSESSMWDSLPHFLHEHYDMPALPHYLMEELDLFPSVVDMAVTLHVAGL